MAKNIKKQLSEFSLINRFNNDAHFVLYAKMVIALMFVPIKEIDNALLTDNLPDYMQPILHWFEDIHVRRMNKGSNERRHPLFPHEMWAIYSKTN